MKRYFWLLLFIIPLLAVGWLAFGQAADPHAGHAPQAPAPQKMTPQKDNAPSEFDELKGMDVEGLQKEGKQQSLAPGSVKISPERQQLIGVRLAKVEKRPLEKVIRTVGRIEYDEKRVGTVSTKIAGWVEELMADFTGRYVAKGQPLLTIYSPDLVSTQEEYLLALRARQSWEKSPFHEISSGGDLLVDSTRRRLRFWDISEAQIGQLEKSGAIQKALTLHSPMSGIILEKMVNRGTYVDPGATLFRIADLSVVWLIADIYEYELSAIRLDQHAEITLDSFGGESFRGKAVYIYPTLDPRTRTARVRFEFPNPKGRLKPEMFANVQIKIDLGIRTAVPTSAVIETGSRKVVLVSKGEGYFEPRDIATGARAEGYYEVIEGLRPDETVVTSANFLIDSESKLKEAVGGGGGHQH
ncbi:MAG: efflux RND transporter periplasmic adaptor subunit [Desulfobacteraceae bacterium]|nr:MAG: efflux RND transporter periplasmic adaptor subunit [Desulfobacteraceae bacterium]